MEKAYGRRRDEDFWSKFVWRVEEKSSRTGKKRVADASRRE